MATQKEIEEILESSTGEERISPLLDYAFCFHMKDPEKMLKLIKEANELSIKHSSREGRGRCYQLLSVYWGIKGNYDKALENALESLSLAEEAGRRDTMCGLYNNLSIIYSRMEDHKRSIECAEKAISIAEEINSPGDKARALNNIALSMESTGSYHDAFRYYSESLVLLEETGLFSQLTIALINTASMAIETGQIGKAEEYAEKAMQYALEEKNSYMEAGALGIKARIQAIQGNREKAEEMFMESLKLAEMISNEDLRLLSLSNLTEFHENNGDYKKALEYNKELSALKYNLQTENQHLLMAKLKAEFETREKEREKELYRLRNIQLQSEKDLAEASDRAKSAFLAMMSHEIRTPMNITLGMLQMLLDKDPRADQIDSLQKAYSSTRSLLGIIVDILDFSRIEAGKFKIEPSPFSLNGLVQSTADMFRDIAHSKGLYFDIRIGENIPEMIVGDPVRVGQILRNLVSNALKFTSVGGITISMEVIRISELSVEVSFTVRDTGIGLPGDKLEDIFKPFHQIDSSMTKEFGGTGLGLTICSRLLEEMNGSITVSSELGRGTAFTFILPFELSDMHRQDGASVDKKPVDLSSKRILVAEDQDSIREIAGYYLENAGLMYAFAENGKEALEMLEKMKFDLVLMDIQMPVMDGITAAEKIRAGGSTIPIIATTGHAMTDHFAQYKKAGINDCLAKPYSREDLMFHIEKWIK